MRLIEGAVEPMDDPRISELEDEIRELRRDLSGARQQVKMAQQDAARAVAALRKQLGPLYQALQMVFGEMDTISDDQPGPAVAMDSRVSAVWNSWKQKLPGNTAKVIDALMLHGEMNSTQIGIAIGIHRNNVPQLIWKLNKAGLITKNGHNYSLKQL